MTLIGDFIGTYRVLALPFPDAFCELLVAEETEPVWLIYCPGVVIETSEEKDDFSRKAGRAIRYKDTTIPLQKFGVVSSHPYFTAAYTEQTQQVLLEYVKQISLTLQTTREQQPGNQHALFLMLMRAIGAATSGPETPSSAANRKTGSSTRSTGNAANNYAFSSRPANPTSRRHRSAPVGGPRRLTKIQLGMITALLTVILIASGVFFYITVPAAHATVTVTPVQKNLDQTYTVVVGQGSQSDPTHVVGHVISFTSPRLSQTVVATGQGVHSATMGQGQVELSQIQITAIQPAGESYLARSSVSDGQGRKIVTDEEPLLKNGGTLVIKAHVEPAGAFSNIPAHDIDGPIDIVDAQTQNQIGTGYITNNDGFSGGHDAVAFTYVKQSDIDNAARTLSNKLTPGIRTRVKQNVSKDEHLIHDVQCSSAPSASRKANDEANQVTVTLSVTCQAVAYTEKMLQDQAASLYQSQGHSSFGNDYGVAGTMVISKPQAIQSDTFSINVKSIWSYQYTPDRIAAIKQMIAGKSKQNALQFLQSRRDMQTVTLETGGGFGTAVPNDFKAIDIVINKVHVP